jgi:RTX calcium-binding nonapeptide repeat (4 copies)/WD40-like Beta Propeller Repeat
MKGVLVGLTAIVILTGGGGASAGSRTPKPTLSFELAAGVSDYDGFIGPLGGGICLGRARVTDPKDDAGTAWSPDGARVAFYRATGPLTADVFVADANGSHLRDLSRGRARFNWRPTWMPDGSRLVYIAADPDREQLMSIRPDGSDLRPIPNTVFPPNRQLDTPDVSPDGAWIGYSLTDGLHLVRPDGSDSRLLLRDASGFTWSADGAHIAFTRGDDLAIANADGTDVRLVTRTPNALEGGAQWSPDGAKLLYNSFDMAPPEVRGPGDHIYLADANGEHRTELHRPRGLPALGPAWRPAAPPVRGTRPCAILGTQHADDLVGTPRADLILARRGNDTVHGRGGDDIIVGDEPFRGRGGRDRLYGGPGRDYIDSYDGRRDLVDGGAGRDRGMFDERDRVKSIERRG